MDSLLENWRLSLFRKPTTISSKIFRSVPRKHYSPYYFTQFKSKPKLYKFRKQLINRRRRMIKKKLILRKKIHTGRYLEFFGSSKGVLSKRTYRLPVVKGTAKFKKDRSAKNSLKKRAKTKVLLKKKNAKTFSFNSKQKFPKFIHGFKLNPKSTVVKTKQIRICKRKQRFNLITMSRIVSNKYNQLAKKVKQNADVNQLNANNITKKVLLKKIKQHRRRFKKHYISSMLTIFFNKAHKEKHRFALKHYKNLIRKRRRLWRRKMRNDKLQLLNEIKGLLSRKPPKEKKKQNVSKNLLTFPISLYQFLLQSTRTLILPPSSKYFKLLKILIIMFRSVLQASFKKQFFYLTLFRQSLLSILTLPTFVPNFFMIRIITLLLLKEFSFKHTNIYYFQKVIASRYFIFQGAHLAIVSSLNSLDKNENIRISFFGSISEILQHR